MKKYSPLILLAIIAATLAILGGKFFNFHEFLAYKAAIIRFTHDNYFVAILLFFCLYTVSVAFSFPGALILTLIGGFLFGTLVGGITIILAATLGAALLFLTASHFTEKFLPKISGKLEALRDGFSKDAFNYLLFLRLTPVFPFWLVNLAPAFLNVPLKTYISATLIGIAPGTFIFASLGANAGDLIGVEGFKLPPTLLLSLGALGILSLLPVILKRFRA